jgi:endonuclease YncB( thermonuclease family)
VDVSRHWKSQRSEWLSPAAYDALSPDERRRLWGDRKAQRRRSVGGGFGRGTIVTLSLGAVFSGLIGAAAWRQWDERTAAADPSAIEWNAVQAVPTRASDAEDVAWERRAESQGSPSTGSGRTEGVRASFGYCKWGGGTNCVVDGDTFYLNGDKVRIAGIDAPETHPPRCDDEARLGDEATKKLHSLLNSGAVTTTSIDRDRDAYGRLLRNVAVNGQDVGEAMISAGVAREYGNGRRAWC